MINVTESPHLAVKWNGTKCEIYSQLNLTEIFAPSHKQPLPHPLARQRATKFYADYNKRQTQYGEFLVIIIFVVGLVLYYLWPSIRDKYYTIKHTYTGIELDDAAVLRAQGLDEHDFSAK